MRGTNIYIMTDFLPGDCRFYVVRLGKYSDTETMLCESETQSLLLWIEIPTKNMTK